jgi:hypothetical protein
MIEPSILWLKIFTISMTALAVCTLLWLVVMYVVDKIQAYKEHNCSKKIKALEDELERYKNS